MDVDRGLLDAADRLREPTGDGVAAGHRAIGLMRIGENGSDRIFVKDQVIGMHAGSFPCGMTCAWCSTRSKMCCFPESMLNWSG
ncbi:hypothetical protein [Kitasatospora sp. SUK 42]|uniref:hypothetical protein n=1 Tax=Kitasatospora sp. SUK 42 TaxID=1588882 RepID=UPI0018CA6230|nr:hypothetical protein [Kitasatospora sp. SUK 42]MBV2155068.1 hypothetical protein [Kitasatospora sp. SUK 42]